MNDLERDDRLAEALRRIEGDPPLDERAERRLHRAIVELAESRFDRLRGDASWWDCVAGWARAAIPAAVAATLVLASLVARGGGTTPVSVAELEGREALALTWTGSLRARDLAEAAIGASDRDVLLGHLVETAGP